MVGKEGWGDHGCTDVHGRTASISLLGQLFTLRASMTYK